MATTKLDLTRQATNSGAVALNGFKLTGVADPTVAQDAATKAYVDSASAGLNWKTSVRAATTAAGTLATSFAAAQIIDGVTLATNDRILIKNQATASENGIYLVTGATPTRTVDANSSANFLDNTAMFVQEGTVNADSAWTLTNNGVITVGTTGLVFTQFAGTGGTGTVTTVSVVSANGFTGTVATPTTTPAITLTTSITGLLKGNGSAILAATVGTDYLAPASFVDKEIPTGLINSANTTYTLANTPVAGSEHVYLNGVLQEAGAGNDYTIATNTITYLAAPLTGDKLRATYRK